MSIADLVYSSEEGESEEADRITQSLTFCHQVECLECIQKFNITELTHVPSVGVSITSAPVLQFVVPAFSVHSTSHLPAPL